VRRRFGQRDDNGGAAAPKPERRLFAALRRPEPAKPGDSARNPRPAGNAGGDAAFTLVELLVTLAIILIVYVMYLSPGAKSYQRGKQAACRGNLQFIYVALQTYAAENHDRYPALKGAQTAEAPLSLLVPRWTTSTELFICPGSGHKKLPPGKPFASRKISYAYAMGLAKQAAPEQWLMSDAQVDIKPKAVGQPLFSADGKKPGNNHRKYGGNLLFADGRTQFSEALAGFAVEATDGMVALNPKP